MRNELFEQIAMKEQERLIRMQAADARGLLSADDLIRAEFWAAARLAEISAELRWLESVLSSDAKGERTEGPIGRSV
jgi:hypothetical protein